MNDLVHKILDIRMLDFITYVNSGLISGPIVSPIVDPIVGSIVWILAFVWRFFSLFLALQVSMPHHMDHLFIFFSQRPRIFLLAVLTCSLSRAFYFKPDKSLVSLKCIVGCFDTMTSSSKDARCVCMWSFVHNHGVMCCTQTRTNPRSESSFHNLIRTDHRAAVPGVCSSPLITGSAIAGRGGS